MRFTTTFRPVTRVLLIVLSVLLLTACSRSRAPEGSLEFFRQNLKSNMDINQIKETFGEAETLEDPLCSVYKYHLGDSTQVWIGYTDKMVYACFVDKDFNLVEDLVEPPAAAL